MQQTTKARTPEESFGFAVGAFRVSQKMSQRDFAAKLTERGMPVDASAVSRIEKGSRSVRLVEALTIAEVLDVDLDFLISRSKTPSQEFHAMRRRTDVALQNLVDPIVDAAYSLWEVQQHLLKHPDLLERLQDKELGRPSKPEEYLDWVTARAVRWEVSEDDYITTESDDEADRIVALIAKFARAHIGTDRPIPKSEDPDNGEHSEA